MWCDTQRTKEMLFYDEMTVCFIWLPDQHYTEDTWTDSTIGGADHTVKRVQLTLVWRL